MDSKFIQQETAICEYVCNKYYAIQYNHDGYKSTIKGILLNYYSGNVVLLSEDGVYHLKYQDIVFTAYSSNNTVKYKIDDNVYVLIPQGDFSAKKKKIGKRDGTGEEYLDIVQIIDKIQTVGGNYVNEPEGFSFAFSTSGNNELKELSFKNEEFIKDYKNKTNLLIGMI